MQFKLNSPYQPSGDQPQAIQQLTEGLLNGERYQTLLGVTGSGKTFTMAKVVELLRSENAEIWINHDTAQSDKLPHAPEWIV